MKYLVTGASGHLGNNLVRLLAKEGHEIRALVRSENRVLGDISGVEMVPGNVLSPESLRSACAGVDCIFHLAGKISTFGDPDGSVFRTNVQGSLNVAHAALEGKVTRMVHCSSVHAFDYSSKPDASLNEEFALATASKRTPAYDFSKAESQRELLSLQSEGLNIVIVNPTGVIGPNDFEPSLMGQVFLQLKSKSLPSLVDGAFDFVDVRDVARGLLSAQEKGRSGQAYLLGNRTASLVEIAQLAEQVTGVAPPWFTCPRWLAQATAPFVEGLSRMTKSPPLYSQESIATLSRGKEIDSAKAREELGYATRPLEESVRDLYQSFAERGL